MSMPMHFYAYDWSDKYQARRYRILKNVAPQPNENLFLNAVNMLHVVDSVKNGVRKQNMTFAHRIDSNCY